VAWCSDLVLVAVICCVGMQVVPASGK